MIVPDFWYNDERPHSESSVSPPAGKPHGRGAPVSPAPRPGSFPHRRAEKTGQAPQKMTSLPTLLNQRYQLLNPLGRGGMALVYRARDLMLERTVAVKILRGDFTDDPLFRERFRQEAQAAANLSHPNIVTVYDYGLADGHPYIVMEYVPGPHLKAYIRSHAPLPVEEALSLAVQACAAIGYAHRAGLVHCDVKPQNLLVAEGLRLKVTDFGIARALSTIRPDEHNDLVWGSPQYFAPEQAAGKPPQPASDVYSLGIILYEMLTGRLPFEGQDPKTLARLHQSASPLPPRRYNPEIPPILEQIILKVLSKEPAARYRTADQLGRILMNIRSAAPGASPSPKAPPAQEEAAPIPPDAPPEAASDPLAVDWPTTLLALLALIAVGGLIPFWMWVYFRFQ